jgi:hypothetical protein
MKTFLIATAASGLLAAGCAAPSGALAPPYRADFVACQGEADRSPRVENLRQRIHFIDECMFKRGWTATPACVQTDQQGTSFCDYRK